jgi:hypothetical protein
MFPETMHMPVALFEAAATLPEVVQYSAKEKLINCRSTPPDFGASDARTFNWPRLRDDCGST